MNLKDMVKMFKTKKKILIVAGLVIALAAGGWFAKVKFLKPAPKQIYSVAVVVNNQTDPDPAEDARSSLKAGDVLVVQPDGHDYSLTEKVSYLILRLNLTEEQAQKLTQSKEREMKKSEMSEEELKRMDEEKRRAKEEGREYRESSRRITLLAREYRIKIEDLGFTDPLVLLSGQPYLDNVYDWGIVEKK